MKYKNEIWKKLPYKGYEISNYGRIRSIDRYTTDKRGVQSWRVGKLLVARTNNIEPHLFTSVVDDKDGTRPSIYLHLWVMLLFGRKAKVGQLYVTHIDKDYSNNHISNLKWITQKELMALQPKRLADPTKSWKTRRKIYGKTGMPKRKNDKRTIAQ